MKDAVALDDEEVKFLTITSDALTRAVRVLDPNASLYFHYKVSDGQIEVTSEPAFGHKLRLTLEYSTDGSELKSK